MANKSAHEVISGLLKKGYCYRQLHDCYGLSASTLHNMANNENYNESASTRELLNKKKPSGDPRWSNK